VLIVLQEHYTEPIMSVSASGSKHLQVVLDDRPLVGGQVEQVVDGGVDVGLQRRDVSLADGRAVAFEAVEQRGDASLATRDGDGRGCAGCDVAAVDGGVDVGGARRIGNCWNNRCFPDGI
jgi:hypothetical protein